MSGTVGIPAVHGGEDVKGEPHIPLACLNLATGGRVGRPQRHEAGAAPVAVAVTGAPPEPVVVAGRHVLDNLLPDRRLRVNPRVVKRAISKYVAKGDLVRAPSYKATVNIDIVVPPEPLTSSPIP